jgi:hypothetical protein
MDAGPGQPARWPHSLDPWHWKVTIDVITSEAKHSRFSSRLGCPTAPRWEQIPVFSWPCGPDLGQGLKAHNTDASNCNLRATRICLPLEHASGSRPAPG